MTARQQFTHCYACGGEATHPAVTDLLVGLCDGCDPEPDPVVLNRPEEYDPDMTDAEWEALAPK